MRVVLGGHDELLSSRLLSRGLAGLRRASAGELLLDEAGQALGVRVVDHLVLGESGLHSAIEGACPPPDPESLVPRFGVG